ncbi:uncharacterized protein LOC133897044 [Phragmites australis]|uniref:uncharacterized protein LOC133897044 n=1 Tax=Phragmites australis TaxID=29695 RepID=UPI002D782897|nr:uncharacterized protein LOC133897044 [Phragmites australis]
MLKSNFNAMRMQEGETLDQCARKLNAMSITYANLREMLGDAALVNKLFDTVWDHFLSVIDGIEQFYDLDTMPFEEAIGQLKAFEEHARPRVSGSNNNGDTGGLGRGRGRGKGHRSGASHNEKENGLGDGRCNKSHIMCYNCYKMGHYVNECTTPKEKEEEKGKTHVTCTDDIEPALLLAVSEEIAPGLQQRWDVVLLNEKKLKPKVCDTSEGGSSSEVWYLDNRASNHITGDKEKFRQLDEDITSRVKFRDGSMV